jgi:hypothetical protein
LKACGDPFLDGHQGTDGLMNDPSFSASLWQFVLQIEAPQIAGGQDVLNVRRRDSRPIADRFDCSR